MLIVAAMVLTLLGLALFAAGWRGIRSTGQPRCARCGYDLRARAVGSVACPECGAELDRPGAIEAFTVRRRRAWISGGTALMIAGLSLAMAARAGLLNARTLDRLTPTDYLLWRAGSETDATSDVAIDRIIARMTMQPQRVSGEQRLRVLERLVERHGDQARSWKGGWGQTIDQAYQTSKLPDALLSRYLGQIVHSSIGLELPDRDLAAGDLIHLTYAVRGARVLNWSHSHSGPRPLWAADDVRYTLRIGGISIAAPHSPGDGFLIPSAGDVLPTQWPNFGQIARVPRRIGEQLASGHHVLEVDLIVNVVDANARERGILCSVTRTFRFPITLNVGPPPATTRAANVGGGA